MGKLVVIEGLDGSGKSTQLKLLPENLKKKGVLTRTVSFPNYESDSSSLVKMYLSGQFGSKPDDVNAYAASMFFAVDRYASFKTDWGEFYNAGNTVIAGRYTTSNAFHQTSKLKREEWEDFLSWLYDIEYEKMQIPKPDVVIFLDMPTDISQKLLTNRYDQNGGGRDIHESDLEYLEHCRQAALFTAKFSGWKIINCANDGVLRTVDDIASEITDTVFNALEEK